MATKKSDSRTKLPGSERVMLRAAKAAGKSDAKQKIQLTIMLQPKSRASTGSARANALLSMATEMPQERHYVTRENFAGERGANPKDIARVESFAHEHHLTVDQISPAERLIKVSGRLEDLVQAFGANVRQYRLGKSTYRGRTGSLSVPTDLSDAVVGVFGFDALPAARPRYRMLGGAGAFGAPGGKRATGKKPKKGSAAGHGRAAPAATGTLKSFSAPEVAQLYGFPGGLDGRGQCIALIELNTVDENGQAVGTGYSTPDIQAYFSKLNLPMPNISAVGIAGGANLPGSDPDSDIEVMLDIQVSGAIAPGAQIVVYFAPNTGKGFVDVLSAVVHDTTRKPSVVSISWGGPEDIPYTTQQQRDGLEQILEDAAELGVTVCCSSGDDGSADLPLKNSLGQPLRDGKPHVDFPASSAFALACGGTRLIADGAAIQDEVVWNDGDPKGPNQPSGATGGGVSNVFDKPSFQSKATVPPSPTKFTGRGVPDVCGNADPATGYLVKLAKIPKLVPVGGTSAVAPLWAGLAALINQRLAATGKGPVGLMNPILYANSGAFRDITVGNNDIDGKLHKYTAAKGWDPCTGLGSPTGSAVMRAFGG
jgi:kumamolisin